MACFSPLSYYLVFIFVEIANVFIFVRSNGCWDQNNMYIDHETMGVLVLSGIMYIGLLNTLFKALKLRQKGWDCVICHICFKRASERLLGIMPIKRSFVFYYVIDIVGLSFSIYFE